MAAIATTAGMAAAGICLSILKLPEYATTGMEAALKFGLFRTFPSSSLKLSSPILPSLLRNQNHFSPLRPCSAVQHTELAEEEKKEDQEVEPGEPIREDQANQRKLFVVNLPWNYSASELESLFGQHGSVDYVEIIKLRDGRNRGFAFVTMASREDAQAAIEKLDSYELAGRIIRVQLAKNFSKPSSKKPQPNTPKGETRHKIYIGNLHWKARAVNLREFFSAKFKPVSARVVFDSSSGKSAGYGFVSFDTKEEMETVVSELEGAELMGRPIRLRAGQKTNVESQTESQIREDESTQLHSDGS